MYLYYNYNSETDLKTGGEYSHILITTSHYNKRHSEAKPKNLIKGDVRFPRQCAHCLGMTPFI